MMLMLLLTQASLLSMSTSSDIHTHKTQSPLSSTKTSVNKFLNLDQNILWGLAVAST